MSEAKADLDLQEQIARIRHTQSLIDLHMDESAKLRNESRKLDAEQSKFNAEQAKLIRDRFLAPWLAVISGLTAGGAIFAAGAAFFHYYLEKHT
jgi:hypothetical protein